jgi:hypothetical protein
MSNYERSLHQMGGAENLGGAEGHVPKDYDIATNGISLHVTEQEEGPAVHFCRGFPDISYTWHRQMNALDNSHAKVRCPSFRFHYGKDSSRHLGSHRIVASFSEVDAVR